MGCDYERHILCNVHGVDTMQSEMDEAYLKKEKKEDRVKKLNNLQMQKDDPNADDDEDEDNDDKKKKKEKKGKNDKNKDKDDEGKDKNKKQKDAHDPLLKEIESL